MALRRALRQTFPARLSPCRTPRAVQAAIPNCVHRAGPFGRETRPTTNPSADGRKPAPLSRKHAHPQLSARRQKFGGNSVRGRHLRPPPRFPLPKISAAIRPRAPTEICPCCAQESRLPWNKEARFPATQGSSLPKFRQQFRPGLRRKSAPVARKKNAFSLASLLAKNGSKRRGSWSRRQAGSGPAQRRLTPPPRRSRGSGRWRDAEPAGRRGKREPWTSKASVGGKSQPAVTIGALSWNKETWNCRETTLLMSSF